jgi:hypothetical protein
MAGYSWKAFFSTSEIVRKAKRLNHGEHGDLGERGVTYKNRSFAFSVLSVAKKIFLSPASPGQAEEL